MANGKKIAGALSIVKADKSEIKAKSRAAKPTISSPAPTISMRRLGFMAGEISAPDDFDQMGSEKIERIFSDGVKNNK